MQLSLHEWEIFFNIAYMSLTAIVSFAIFILYKAMQPVYYGFLFWAFFILLCASLFLGLYGESLDLFIATKTKTPEEALVRENLISNLKVLVFIVPGVMAGVAANLITAFLLKEKPSK